MDLEPEPEVEGRLARDHVRIADPEMRLQLEARGYGEESHGEFHLKPFEALYLLYTDRLRLLRGNQRIDFDRMMKACTRYDSEALTKFLIYRDLRTRGYTVKDGFGFGSDFRVYDRGHFGEKGAKYLIFGLNEGRQEKIGRLQKKIEEITQMGKEPVIAVIERRGEVIYYRISKTSFQPNKHRIQDAA